MAILSITAAGVTFVARLDTTVDSDDMLDAAAVIADQQVAFEASLDPLAFAQSDDVVELLRVNVEKLLAAELLQMRTREDGASGSLTVAGVTIGAVPDHAAELRSVANAALAPYLRRVALDGHVGANPSVGNADAAPAVTQRGQDRLFGPSESDRLQGRHWRL